MDKQCKQCEKTFNAKRNTQKFCSVECQHNSYKIEKVEKVKRECIKCGNFYYKIPSKSGSKYCSRECKDTHQKEIYVKEGNPIWGRKSTISEKKIKSDFFKELWKTKEFKNSVKNGLENFFKENGYWPGTDELSKEKRKETMIKRYGIEHNWNGEYGERECDKTTIEKYGKTSAQMLIDYLHYFNKKTDIEIIFEKILVELEIPFQCKFRIYDKNKINFWFREYDFLIINTNILIEVDGDYWHGNKKIFKELSDFQKSVQVNDIMKENFAKNNSYEIIRFWGSDIKRNKNAVKNKLKEIWERLN